MLKIWKMEADFQNVYRYSVCLCSSLVLAEVLEYYCNPVGGNELSFLVSTCVFLSLAWFGIPACFRLSCIVGKTLDADCWFPLRNVDAVAAKRRNCRFLLKKTKTEKQNNFPSRPIKRLARQEVQPPCFLLTWYVPRPQLTGIRNDPDQMIRFDLFRFLKGKKCSSICPEKATEDSIQMTNAPADLLYCVGAFLWGDLDEDQWSKIAWIIVHQRNRWIRDQSGFIGSFDVPGGRWIARSVFGSMDLALKSRTDCGLLR